LTSGQTQELHRFRLSWVRIAFSTAVFAALLGLCLALCFAGFVAFRRARARVCVCAGVCVRVRACVRARACVCVNKV
jgi:hypothetical protein